jgi:hypothetical protein
MSYESYREWLRHLPIGRLDEEVVKNRRNRNNCAANSDAYKAWDRMLQMAKQAVNVRNNSL